jgi:ectoine hydroxylase-related dioxygenase (phytanoyl-CoA dioxygenase family)
MPLAAEHLAGGSADHQAQFERDGFLVLPAFFDARSIAAAQADIDAVKLARPFDVVIDNLENGDRTVLGLMTPEAIAHDRMKINDLYLFHENFRGLALSPPLLALLNQLLGHTPALCNSLYLEKGSAQQPHVDSLYMTPRTRNHLIAAWVAMEDSDLDAGPLEYFPGSHRIEPMVFSDGGYHFNQAEMARWGEYMHEAVTRAGLQKLNFSAKKGDVFIWHANFLHGGGPINNPALTRKSCVFHYFSQSDASAGGYTLVPQSGAFWIDRPPPSLPPEIDAQLPFSELNYLRRNPDVAAAVKAGIFTSGYAHYENFGKREGRPHR